MVWKPGVPLLLSLLASSLLRTFPGELVGSDNLQEANECFQDPKKVQMERRTSHEHQERPQGTTL